jgi:epoxide hydrolase
MSDQAAIRPFRIGIPTTELDDLRERLTRTAGSSARLYYEAARSGWSAAPVPSTAPTGVAVFPAEIAPPVRCLAEQSNHIVHWSEFDRGGHFAAMEEPDLLVGDVREFFRLFR